MKNIILILLLNISFSVRGNELLSMSKKLAKLRVEVEEQNENVQEVRRKFSGILRSYSIQKAELEASLRKEEIKKKQILIKVGQLKNELKKSDAGHVELAPIVNQYIDRLRKYIKSSIPYKSSERSQNLISIQDELEKKEIRSYQALSRLWSAYEDEQRMSKENQLTKQTINVSGRPYLAEVLKLGTYSMFFRLENGTYGKAVKREGAWQFLAFRDESKIQAGRKLFDGIKKQVKTGEYLIPNLL